MVIQLSAKLKAGVVSEAPRETDTPPKFTELLDKALLPILLRVLFEALIVLFVKVSVELSVTTVPSIAKVTSVSYTHLTLPTKA